MAAATMQYEGAVGLVSGVTAAPGRLCGITDTAARWARPFKIKKASGIGLELDARAHDEGLLTGKLENLGGVGGDL